MDSLSRIEVLRLKNLRALHARPGGSGGPTSDYLVTFLNEKGMSLTNNELTHIYQRKTAISDYRAKSIEKAFGLEPGWLSEDHEFLYNLTSADISTHANLAALPENIKEKIYALVDALASSRESSTAQTNVGNPRKST